MRKILLLTSLASLLMGCQSTSIPIEHYLSPKQVDQRATIAKRHVASSSRNRIMLAALKKGICGAVKFKYYVDDKGQVNHVEVLNSYPGGLIEEAIVARFKKHTFHPALKNGVAVPSWNTSLLTQRGEVCKNEQELESFLDQLSQEARLRRANKEKTNA